MAVDRDHVDRAKAHLFSAGVADTAEQLGLANMVFGIAKIQWVERRLGLDPRAVFIGAPDATVTRNARRWAAGFGYGGQLRWSPEIAVLDALPNGCGMLVGATTDPPDEQRTRLAAAAAQRARLELDGVPLEYDLGDSNHFVDVCELEQVLDGPGDDTRPGDTSPAEATTRERDQLPAHLFVIHSSGHEHRARSPLGPGLYLHLSEELQRRAEVHSTPWGSLSVLTGDEARDHHRFCEQVQRFNCRRRELYAELLFGPHRTLCNATHQGFRQPGVFHLGSYWFERRPSAGAGSTGALFPLTLGPDQPLFLLRPRANFQLDAIRRLGWLERAEQLGLLDALTSADLLPHGGGYSYPDLARLRRVESAGERRTFVVERRDPAQPALHLDAITPHRFAYRGLEVLERLVDLSLAEPVARYRIRFVIKR